MNNNIKIGNLGENIACNFLEKKGFKIIERNYRKKWGEIDIIAQSFNNTSSAQFGKNRGKKRNKSYLLTKISSVFPAVRAGVLHFVEVKAVSVSSNVFTESDSVSRENRVRRNTIFHNKNNVTRETITNNYNNDYDNKDVWFQPEDNVHPRKQNRLRKAIQSYLLQPRIPEDIEWRFDIIALWIDIERKKARIKFIEDIVL